MGRKAKLRKARMLSRIYLEATEKMGANLISIPSFERLPKGDVRIAQSWRSDDYEDMPDLP